MAQGTCDGFLRFRAVLTWTPTPTTQAHGYVLYRDDGAGGPIRVLRRLDGRFTDRFVDRNLGSAATYRYRIRSSLGSRLSAPSPVALAETPLLCMG